MKTTNRIVIFTACLSLLWLGAAAAGCGSQPSDEPGFSPYPDSPLRVRSQEYDIAVGATSRIEVGPWEFDPSILEHHGRPFELVSAKSSHPDILPADFESPATKSHRQFVTVRALDEGSAWLRVEGRLDDATRAFQSVALHTEEPVDAEIHFHCPEGMERPVFVSNGDPVRFGVTTLDADGDLLAGSLERDIELIGPGGVRPQFEQVWMSNLPFARSSFVPPVNGEYTVVLDRFGRSASFEVVGPEAAEALGEAVCDSRVWD